jgi:hypothetical protein
MSTEKEKLALEQLEAEKQRRVAAKIEAGDAVRVLLSAVATQDLDAVRERKLAELRAAGERREIIWDEIVIDTGVPRSADTYRNTNNYTNNSYRNNALKNDAPASDGPPAYREPGVVAQAGPMQEESAMCRVRTQLEGPSDRYPAGHVAEGWFSVSNGVIHVEDLEGRVLGQHVLRPGEDAEATARKILRQKAAGASNFYAPIAYRKH